MSLPRMRDFQSRGRGASAPRLRRLAYATELLAARANCERVGLVVVGVHDWDGPRAWVGAPGVAQLVLAPDVAPEAADWSPLALLDVLVTACAGVDGASDAPWHDVVMAAFANGAASVWVELDAGVQRVYLLRGRMLGDRVVPRRKFGAALREHRVRCLAFADWPFDDAAFDDARRAHYAEMIGDDAVAADMVAQMRAAATPMRRAA